MFSVVAQRPLPFTPFTFGSIRPHPDAAPMPSIESVPVVEPEPLYTPSHQPFDALLVLDVEATCQEGTDFQWPNEIIEFPVCLLKWTDKGKTGKASKLEIVDEFRSFVKPTWRPNLTQFCTNLTGITQEQVDAAPHFPEVADMFTAFLMKHGLLHPHTGERIARFCWCTDGPFDVRDFVVKQCFISNVSIIPMPYWIRGDVMDVRKAVGILSGLPQIQTKKDSRNIARIVIELARRGICLQPNTFIHPGRRWAWMGKHGQILEEYCMT
ncbi:hypothetical protein EWM64_g2045 [Hericium alpestre]|uniref:Exonuclease domain-containing protein n=1 Tax=Hericium alpestre TaxID=135208 RepID=A0A4Z0A4K2_9AGAM|nr:hypothetical protein EWM64_g2045 [Hericium alpestre]